MAHSAIGRLAIMSLLSLFLMVPMTMVDSMVRERSNRRDEAVSEVGASWGGRQTISGPVLVVPYTQAWADDKGRQQSTTGQAYFLPSELRVDAVVTTQPRSRGIFDVVVYTTTVKVEGTFLRPALDWLRPVPTDVRWGDATVTVGVSDPKALTRRASLVMPASGDTAPFAGGMVDVGLFNAGVRAPVPGLNAIPPGAAVPFAFTLELHGTRDLRFLPTADETSVKVSSEFRTRASSVRACRSRGPPARPGSPPSGTCPISGDRFRRAGLATSRIARSWRRRRRRRRSASV
jgi:inner membrane protein